MKCLLDTSALLAHARHEAQARQIQAYFDDEDTELLLCSVTLAEMARRLRELTVPEERIWEIINEYADMAAEIVPVTSEIARLADTISAKATARLPMVDALIAAASAARNASLVHRDAHMASIPPGKVDQIDLR